MVRVIVCGGSIGGLSAALNLLKAGCEVTVYERASAIQPAGAVCTCVVQWLIEYFFFKSMASHCSA